MNILIAQFGRTAAWTPPSAFVDSLAQEFPEHAVEAAPSYDIFGKRLSDADVALTAVLDRSWFARPQRVRWVQVPAVDVRYVVFDGLVDSPVIVTNARGIRARAIAEHVLCVSIALARQLPLAAAAQSRRQWAQDAIDTPRPAVRTLRGLTMGIVGFGAIGREVATLAGAFGLRVKAVRRRANGSSDLVEEMLPPERLRDLLSTSDIVVLAAPATPATTHLIGPAEVAVLKRGALLVNVARGELVDDVALIDGLATGHVGGAALDVFTREPLSATSPYWQLPNVIVTPHTSGVVEDYWRPLAALFAENIRRFQFGRPLLNEVDKRAGY